MQSVLGIEKTFFLHEIYYICVLIIKMQFVKTQFYVFFSWQSDIEGNKSFINKKIKEAVSAISKMPEMLGCKINYDHSTQNRSGSPSIVDTIHEKINSCDVFIADITPISSLVGTKEGKDKLIPNPNVMAEAGFALRAIGDKRIILMMRKDTGSIDNLPFDIRHRRISLFDLSDNKSQLQDYILSALIESKYCHENEYEKNIVGQGQRIFEDFKKVLISETTLFSVVENNCASQRISKWDYNYFDRIVYFFKNGDNQFIIKDIALKAVCFMQAVDNYTNFTAGAYRPMLSSWQGNLNETGLSSEEEEELNTHNFYYSWIDKKAGEWLDEDKYENRLSYISDNLHIHYNAVKQSYIAFRKVVSEFLFV